MVSILDKKTELRPVLFPEFVEAHNKVLSSHWSHLEVDIQPDIYDWCDKLSDTDKKVIGNTFKAFTLQEGIVNDYWRTVVADKFFHPEIIHMATAFSAQESIHALAYDFLESNLPLNECVTTDWKEDPVARQKVDAILDLSDISDLPTSLAAFSAFIEGVSLYSSFAVLLSFTKKGYLKAMFEILSWSVRDENNHSAMGIALYKKLRDEGYVADENKLYDIAKLIVRNEIDFIRNAFGDIEELETVSLTEVESFIKHRANKKLMELDLNPIFDAGVAYKGLADFFYTTVEGKSMNDFFAMTHNGGGYSAVTEQNFENCKYD